MRQESEGRLIQRGPPLTSAAAQANWRQATMTRGMVLATELFESTLDWLRRDYSSFRFFAERDVV